jgi:hypothetical protein
MGKNLKKVLFFVTLGSLTICLQGCTDSYNLELDDSIDRAVSQHSCSIN